VTGAAVTGNRQLAARARDIAARASLERKAAPGASLLAGLDDRRDP
jgi:hypothetical protein